MNKFNDYVGEKLSQGLSNMNMFWIMLLATMTPAIFSPPTTLTQWDTLLSSGVFQAVALVVINYTTEKATKFITSMLIQIRDAIIDRIEGKLQETHDAVIQELQEVKEELDIARDERDKINQLMQQSSEERNDIRNILAEIQVLINK